MEPFQKNKKPAEAGLCCDLVPYSGLMLAAAGPF
jgi:hypothetical protein